MAPIDNENIVFFHKSVDNKNMRENCLKWFGCVQLKGINTPVRKSELVQVEGMEKRQRKTKNNINKSSKK